MNTADVPGPGLAAPHPRPRPAPPKAGWRTSRFRLRNWPLRRKQIVVILVPTLTALFLGYLRISSELAKADEFSRTVAQVELSGTISAAVHELQAERDLVVGQVASNGSADRAQVTEQINRVENALNKFREEPASFGELDGAVQAQYRKVKVGLGTLDAIRALADTEKSKYPAGDILFSYDNVIGSLLQLSGEITRVSDNRTISEQAARFDALTSAKEQMAIQNSILRAAVVSNEFAEDLRARLRSAQAEFNAELNAFQESADRAARSRYSDTVAGSEVDNRLRLIQIALNRGDKNASINLDVKELDTVTRATLDKIQRVESASLNEVRGSAESLIATARNNALRDAAFIALALAVALLLMLVVSRSLLMPLRVLRRDALDVANRRLPATVQRILADPNPLQAFDHAVEPVPVFTTEEVGQVARSFDVVQHQAVRMATEQAVLRDNINSIFVNLARRSQTLVERQLALIDLLERDEEDPDQLANLFELDHLATRMRRNSESLLVLSGSGLPRQMSRPVPAADLVGAAVSEVEQYKRIEVTSSPDVLVDGRAVSDLVHLIAELLDNATFFSQPEKKVKVRMVVTRTQELLIQVTDCGVGMSEEEIRISNERLAAPPDLDVAVTRRMGLYVVARLAEKHNITVRLRENEDLEGGLITRVIVPPELISYARSTAMTQPAATSGAFERQFRGPHSGTDTRLARVRDIRPPAPTRMDHMSAGPDTNGGPRHREPAPTVLFDDQRPAPAEATASRVASVLDGGKPAQPEPPGPGETTTTQRLPIYEDVLSRWFAPEPEPAADNAEPTTGTGQHAVADTGSWNSVGDEGWLAAQALLAGGGEQSVTAKGLPKRVPKARLVPGSPGAGQVQQPDPAPADQATRRVLPPRSAQVARGRMANFQQGLRRGRSAVTGEPASNGDDQRSEQ